MSFEADQSLSTVFDVLYPVVWNRPALFSSPHSGSVYPSDLMEMSRLRLHELRKLEDCYVDELFSHVVQQGAPLLRAKVARAYVDLNREAFELDPDMFDEALPESVNSQSHRVMGGLGTLPRRVAEGKEIYQHKFSFAEALARIEQYYHPYHQQLRHLLDAASHSSDEVVLVDCHSMPAVAARQSAIAGGADVVIGDCGGRSCDRQITLELENLLRAKGLKVGYNIPFSGGFITQYYGKPAGRQHALQIEINRQLYLNEATYEKTRGFQVLHTALTQVTAQWLEWLANRTSASRLAAE